jgi:hypothetical protein
VTSLILDEDEGANESERRKQEIFIVLEKVWPGSMEVPGSKLLQHQNGIWNLELNP